MNPEQIIFLLFPALDLEAVSVVRLSVVTESVKGFVVRSLQVSTRTVFISAH